MSGNFGYYWAPRQLVGIGVSQKPLFAPGHGYAYSNTNYVLAQLIVERVTGNTIGAELKRRIFQPLHLRDTIYQTKPGLPSPYAQATSCSGSLPRPTSPAQPVDVSGLGRDRLHRQRCADFYRALLSGRLLSPKQMQAMKTTVSERTGKVVVAGPETGSGRRLAAVVRRLGPRERAPRLRGAGDLE